MNAPIAIVGVGETPPARRSEHDLRALVLDAVGAALAPVTPHTDTAFWAAAGVVAAAALGLYVAMPYRAEPGHRSPLPVWVKFLAIQGVILCLVALKSVLGGFMTMFPMVAIIAAYEARTCLWTICRRIPVIMLSVLPMMIVVRLSQSRLGLGVGLGLGWMAFLLALSVVGRPGRRERAAQMVGEPNVR